MNDTLITAWRALRQAAPDLLPTADYHYLRQHMAELLGAEDGGDACRRLTSDDIERATLFANEIGCDRSSLWACLLYGVVSTPIEGKQRLAMQTLSPDIATLLEGLARADELFGKSQQATTSENFPNLLLSACGDLRVMLILTVSNLYQLRNAAEGPQRTLLSGYAANIYAPLAHKLGLYKIKSELEDLSLKYLNHDAYYHIKEKLHATKAARDAYIADFIRPIEEKLTAAGLKFHIKGRTKSIHSIHQKMRKQGCPFEGVYDLFAIRIILDAPPAKEKMVCWQTYSIVTDMYRPEPKRLRDWLSVPKSNGYESLHTTVLGPQDKWVEIQIRTERMDEIAEHGLAAHWRYKGVGAGEGGIETWLARYRADLESGQTPTANVQAKSAEEIYVFTPKGDLFRLVSGATVLDFAYHIHSNVGNHCTGAIVNGVTASMRTELKSGDSVSVLTSAAQRAKPAWVDYVHTTRAKAKIRQAVREAEMSGLSIAREQLERTFRNRKIELDQDVMHFTLSAMGYKEISLFFRDLNDGRRTVDEFITLYLQNRERRAGNVPVANNQRNAVDAQPTTDLHQATASADDVLVVDTALKGADYTMAHCCNPVYGDEIFGFITRENGIRIHRATCPNAPRLRERHAYRIIAARWAVDTHAGHTGGALYPLTLRIVGLDQPGVVSGISSIVSREEKLNMRSFSIDTNDGMFSGSLTLMIADAATGRRLIKKLEGVKGVKKVSRA